MDERRASGVKGISVSCSMPKISLLEYNLLLGDIITFNGRLHATDPSSLLRRGNENKVCPVVRVRSDSNIMNIYVPFNMLLATAVTGHRASEQTLQAVAATTENQVSSFSQ